MERLHVEHIYQEVVGAAAKKQQQNQQGKNKGMKYSGLLL